MFLNKKGFKLAFIFIATVLVIAVIRIIMTNIHFGSAESPSVSDPVLSEGKRLSEIYCSGCHKYPEPELLPKHIWESEIFPEMGPLLGIFEHGGVQYNFIQNRSQLQYLPPGYYPEEALLSSEEWEELMDYYLALAPDILSPATREPEILTDPLFFKAHIPENEFDRIPNVASVKFDTFNKLIYISEFNQNTLMVFDEQLQLSHSLDLHLSVVDIDFSDDPDQPENKVLYLTSIGSFEPSNEPLGSFVEVRYQPEQPENEPELRIIMDQLIRPVESRFLDLTGNGLNDLLIAEFGHRTGSLFWLENSGDGFNLERNVLIREPGCIQTHSADINQNGLMDVAALCTQVDQSFYLFENLGGGEFQSKRLIQFNATAGSSSFELHDFNGDGHPDILYTSGDNADYSKVFKPYHGIYIFLNDGEFNFTQEWFYPMNGAYRAVARDFNKNGRLDIAAIAYFADYNENPEEGFLFFKNEGGMRFTPYHHPDAGKGRWLTMDITDWTGNGLDDILLGSFPQGPATPGHLNQGSWDDAPPFLLLENTGGGLE